MAALRTESAADRVIVVGAGLAGVATALHLAPLPVLLLGPGLGATASAMAQGGIAVAMGPGDDPACHAADTLAAGAGLCDPDIVAVVTGAGSALVEDLLRRGVPFDRDADGVLERGLEAAHDRPRILHAGGDATGHTVLRTLTDHVAMAHHVTRQADLIARRLAVTDGRVTGLWAVRADGAPVFLAARAVVLATGGVGGLYAATTNPRGACGSGLALAARAGAVLRDLEFVQFHPTAIATGADPMPLATEALRGAGAVLVEETGARLMAGSPQGDLAPRDVVARAIHAARAEGRSVFLDARAAVGADFARRFPTVHRLCRAAGLDPAREAIPVRPAAHYHMGGVAVDAQGRTSLPGLHACGEVASTGLHGANRLASNSLLEALAFARWIAQDILSATAPAHPAPPLPAPSLASGVSPDQFAGLRAVMDRHVGVVRSAGGLEQALRRLAPHAAADDAHLVASLVALAALDRRESRGGHFRADHPAPAPEARHSTVTLAGAFPRLAAFAPVPEVA
ncbi:MAG: L-aspartate oxidase [Rhizobiales bacterium 35-68-8]|nr:MAG: L-aspartate oxidase [Rhizobiales bacterium 35-68-8]